MSTSSIAMVAIVLSIVFFNVELFAADCTTTADNTWNCGIPTPSDHLIINHSVTINGDFNLTGSITINNGGHLTINGGMVSKVSDIKVNKGGSLLIHGAVSLSSNCSFIIDGFVELNQTLMVKNSSVVRVSGNILVQGFVTISSGGKLDIETSGVFHTNSDFIANSNFTYIDGSLHIVGSFTNNKSITGAGQITYTNNCLGSGTINGHPSSDYCGTGTIDLGTMDCIATDTTNPVFVTFPTDLNLYLTTGQSEIAATWGIPTASDNCALQGLTSTADPGDLFPLGKSIVSYKATDVAGNSVEQSFSIQVIDTISPTFNTFPPDLTLYVNESSCTSTANWKIPEATDNCSSPSISSSHNPGDTFPLGISAVYYTATDAAGNSKKQSFEIIVLDTISPKFISFPSDITLTIEDASCSFPATWNAPEVTDNCSAVTTTSSHQPGASFPIDTSEVSYSITDESGNTTYQSFNVTIISKTVPAFATFPEDIFVETDENMCSAQVYWDEPEIDDHCSKITISSNYQSGHIFPVGITEVQYLLKDVSGNSSSQSFKVTVQDLTLPVFTECPTNYTIVSKDFSDNTSVVTWSDPVAIDNCSSVYLSGNFASGDKFTPGITEVTYTAMDATGNEAKCGFTIEIAKNLPPVADNISRYMKAGESIDICLSAPDPNNNEIKIREIIHEDSLTFLSNIDTDALCFEYSTDLNFYGKDTVIVILEDIGAYSETTTVYVFIEVERNINVEINDVLTINGDGINDSWLINNIDQYPNNTVKVFDRSGSLIYKVSGYNNTTLVWSGEGNSAFQNRNRLVDTGTYFYAIDLGNETKTITGALEVIR